MLQDFKCFHVEVTERISIFVLVLVVLSTSTLTVGRGVGAVMIGLIDVRGSVEIAWGAGLASFVVQWHVPGHHGYYRVV